jgi:hypothetical protein
LDNGIGDTKVSDGDCTHLLDARGEDHLRVPGEYLSKYDDGPGLIGVLTEGKPMKVVRTLAICTFLLSLAAAAGALNPDRDIHQLAHRSWGEKDGYPGKAEALAQTGDGFLRIGTDPKCFRARSCRPHRSGDPL